MNRRDRRLHNSEMRRAFSKAKPQEVRPEDEGYMILGKIAAVPVDIKADITRVAQSVQFTGIDGGDCVTRVCIGYKVMCDLGWHPDLFFGGVLYRAGPHPGRDVVAFCGKGNRGYLHEGKMFLGHVWLRMGDELIDFSCKDWPRLYVPKDGMGPVHWVRNPPDVVWAPEYAFNWNETGEPDIGEIWYCPWVGPEPQFLCSEQQVLEQANVFADTLSKGIARTYLIDRVRDARELSPAVYDAKWRHMMRKKELA